MARLELDGIFSPEAGTEAPLRLPEQRWPRWSPFNVANHIYMGPESYNISLPTPLHKNALFLVLAAQVANEPRMAGMGFHARTAFFNEPQYAGYKLAAEKLAKDKLLVDLAHPDYKEKAGDYVAAVYREAANVEFVVPRGTLASFDSFIRSLTECQIDCSKAGIDNEAWDNYVRGILKMRVESKDGDVVAFSYANKKEAITLKMTYGHSTVDNPYVGKSVTFNIDVYSHEEEASSRQTLVRLIEEGDFDSRFGQHLNSMQTYVLGPLGIQTVLLDEAKPIANGHPGLIRVVDTLPNYDLVREELYERIATIYGEKAVSVWTKYVLETLSRMFMNNVVLHDSENYRVGLMQAMFGMEKWLSHVINIQKTLVEPKKYWQKFDYRISSAFSLNLPGFLSVTKNPLLGNKRFSNVGCALGARYPRLNKMLAAYKANPIDIDAYLDVWTNRFTSGSLSPVDPNNNRLVPNYYKGTNLTLPYDQEGSVITSRKQPLVLVSRNPAATKYFVGPWIVPMFIRKSGMILSPYDKEVIESSPLAALLWLFDPDPKNP